MRQGGEAPTFDRMISELRSVVEAFPDKRTGANTHFSMTDIALSAFSVFFTQSESFLDFQRQIGRSNGKHNLASLFGVRDVPSDNHIRSMLDVVPAAMVYPMFDWLLCELERLDELDRWRSVGNDLLITLDGTEYYRSQSIHCPRCRVSHHANGQVDYSHQLLSPAIVKPEWRRALALSPEFIRGEDGQSKAEGELTAAKRWISSWADRLSPLGVTICGDDIYATEPFLRLLAEHELNYVCVCKPQSHKYLSECIESLSATGDVDSTSELVREGSKKRRVSYRWVQQVPLTAYRDALLVDWVSVEVTDESGERLYYNSFITNHRVSAETVATVVAAGRARWKVENEDINTLKTKGYHLEHNFGHGKSHLCETLATLNILAFSMHTLLDLYDARYALLRRERGRRTRFFQELGTLTAYIYFESWQVLLVFMIEQLQLPDPGG